MQDFAYTVSIFFRGQCPRTHAEALPVLRPSHQFPLRLPAFPLFLIYEMTIDLRNLISVSIPVA